MAARTARSLPPRARRERLRSSATRGRPTTPTAPARPTRCSPPSAVRDAELDRSEARLSLRVPVEHLDRILPGLDERDPELQPVPATLRDVLPAEMPHP